MRWDIRDRADMDELRAELMACPEPLRVGVLADFAEEPMLAAGLRATALRRLGSGGIDPAGLWRAVVENVVPRDGRHPQAATLRRFMAAAERAGWLDPRADAGPSPSP